MCWFTPAGVWSGVCTQGARPPRGPRWVPVRRTREQQKPRTPPAQVRGHRTGAVPGRGKQRARPAGRSCLQPRLGFCFLILGRLSANPQLRPAARAVPKLRRLSLKPASGCALLGPALPIAPQDPPRGLSPCLLPPAHTMGCSSLDAGKLLPAPPLLPLCFPQQRRGSGGLRLHLPARERLLLPVPSSCSSGYGTLGIGRDALSPARRRMFLQNLRV